MPEIVLFLFVFVFATLGYFAPAVEGINKSVKIGIGVGFAIVLVKYKLLTEDLIHS